MFLNKNALATFFKKRQQHDTDKKNVKTLMPETWDLSVVTT